MNKMPEDKIKYTVMDPTGNITALVESPADICSQPETADWIMRQDRSVEQVGFVDFTDKRHLKLEMAGGEFCGNASMSAAALYAIRNDMCTDHPVTVLLDVSGASRPVGVVLEKKTDGSFFAQVLMPRSLGIENRSFSFENIRADLPAVRMEGICHVIIENNSEFFSLKADPSLAEKAVRIWCRELSAECLGLMFLEERSGRFLLDPLVYVPGSGTVFWENSCASGSSAAGIYLASKISAPIDISFTEPGGILNVQADPSGTGTILSGNVKLLKEYG